MTRVLVTGSGGQVGIELARLEWPQGIELLVPARRELDLANARGIAEYLAAAQPDAIVNPAAYTGVDAAETDVAAAYAVNALAPAAMAAYARRAEIPLVHFSTDYVFGSGSGFRLEGDPPAPTSVYGASKLAGELAVTAACEGGVVIRTAWVVSPWRRNFVETMLRLARDRDEISVVADQRGCPTIAGDLAAAARTVTVALLNREAPGGGVVHFVNAGEASWAELAEETMALARQQQLPHARVRPIGSDEYPTPVKRPSDSRLATDRIRERFKIEPRPWQDALAETVAALAAQSEEGRG